jgi:hypothetical protein
MTSQELFYPKERVLGKLLTLHPAKLFGVLCGIAIILLILPARWIGIAVAPDGILNKAFYASYNWSLMYTVLLPLIFVIASATTGSLMKKIDVLTAKATGAIVRKDGTEATEYAFVFQEKFSHYSRRIIIASILLALLIEIGDSWHVWAEIHRYLTTGVIPTNADWSVALTVGKQPGWIPPGFYANLAFDIVAYLVQTFYIFLGFYWVIKYWLFLKTFSDLMIPESAPFLFKPKDANPKLRLGLRPLGSLFNNFLAMGTIFLAYILFHRFQLIQRYCHRGFPDYVSDVLSKMKDPKAILDFANPVYAFGCTDAGMWMLLIFLALPIVVIVSFPLWTLRRYVTERRDKRIEDLGARLQIAVDNNKAEEAKALEERIQRLDKACVWPNGDRAARYFLLTLGILALASWLPPMLVILAASGIFFVFCSEIWTILKARET